MKKLAITVLALALTFSLVACGSGSGSGESSAAADEQIVITYAHDAYAGGPEDAYAQQLQSNLNTASDGRITLDIYTAGDLGDGVAEIEQLQLGALDMVECGTSSVETIIPELGVFNIPFLLSGDLTESHEQINEEETFGYFEGLYDAQGLKLLDLESQGGTLWTCSKRFLKTPEDFNGIKMRVMDSPMLQAEFKSFGASPVTIAFSELYSGLQLGMADGQTNGWSTVAQNKFYEVQHYITVPGADNYMTNVVVNPEFWDSLSAEDQEIIIQAIYDTYDWYVDYIEGSEADARKVCEDYGCEVYELTDAEREVFKGLTGPIEEEFAKAIGADKAEEVLAIFK